MDLYNNIDVNYAQVYQQYSQPPPTPITTPVIEGGTTVVTTINGAGGSRINFDGSAIGISFTGSTGGVVVMSISNATIFRTAISAAKSGVNSDISELNGASQVDVSGEYKVNGVQVVTNQQAAIPDVAGGATVDTEARAALNSLLTALRLHGLIAT